MDLKEKVKKIVNLFSIEKYDDAINSALILNKKFPEQEIFYNILSLSYQAKSDFDKSFQILNKGLKLFKNNIHFLNNLGLTHYKSNNLKEAEIFFNRVLDINDSYIETLNNLGLLKYDLNDIQSASNLFQKSLKINPNILQTNYNYSALLQSIGKYDEAKTYLKKALDLNPSFTLADQSFAMLNKYSLKDAHLISMEKKLINSNLSKLDLSQLNFALGKAYADTKDYNKSFQYIKTANQLKKQVTKYNLNSDLKTIEKIKTIYTDMNNKKIIFKFKKDKIIFILGMPRSGTSLIEQIISNHKDVFGGGEIKYLSENFDNFLKMENFNIQSIVETFETYGDEYMGHLKEMYNIKNIFTDKAVLNFRWVGFIKKIFPNSKIIHCTRNSLENCWSIYKNDFKGGLNFSNDLLDLGGYYNSYKNLMSFWKKHLNADIFEAPYESMINNSEEKIKEIIKFCDLTWDENCLKFYDNKRPIKTVSFNQAREPIYNKSLNASRAYEKHLSSLKSILEDN
jgi:tetratricopeptide (TPR) repeat protein